MLCCLLMLLDMLSCVMLYVMLCYVMSCYVMSYHPYPRTVSFTLLTTHTTHAQQSFVESSPGDFSREEINTAWSVSMANGNAVRDRYVQLYHLCHLSKNIFSSLQHHFHLPYSIFLFISFFKFKFFF